MYPWEHLYPAVVFKKSKSAKLIYPNTASLLTSIAMDRFSWSGTDAAGDEITSEQVERVLMSGAAVLRKQDGIIYPLSPKAVFDNQGRICEGRAVRVDKSQIPVSTAAGDVFYWGTDVYSLIMEYAIRLTKIMQTVDVNVVTSRIQYLLVGDGSNEDELLDLAENIQDADKTASITLGAAIDPREILVTTGANLITDELLKARQSVIGQFSQALGIHVNATEKAERLITSEVRSGEDLACMIYRREYEKRKGFADAAGWKVEACYTYAGGKKEAEKIEGAAAPAEGGGIDE